MGFIRNVFARLDVGRVAVGLAVVVASCGGESRREPPPESWVAGPVSEWPDFALTSDIRFTDTTYAGIANAFLVDTGPDTVGVTVKHVFMAFQKWREGVSAIELGDDFISWHFRSSRDPGRSARGRLLNEDPGEPIGDFAGMKDRDWLVFELDTVPAGLHPLRPRYRPLEPGEAIRAVGRSMEARDDRDPTPSPLRVFRAAGTYYYVQVLDRSVDPVQTSGSAVIDRNGHLVGIVSGSVGELGVVAGVEYLRRLFEEHGIPYERGVGK